MDQPVKFTPIDLASWSRGSVFYYFSKMAPTGYSLTAELDITKLKQALDEAGLKFFPAYLWLTTKLLNEQIEFKIAERDSQLGYYDTITPLYASFHEDDKTFSLLWTEYTNNFMDFYHAYLENQEKHKDQHGILGIPNAVPPENAYTVSCLPWISFKHFAVHSYENKPYYFPSVEAGKFYEESGKLLLPMSITCHHAATDGWHVSEFLKAWQKEADAFGRYV